MLRQLNCFLKIFLHLNIVNSSVVYHYIFVEYGDTFALPKTTGNNLADMPIILSSPHIIAHERRKPPACAFRKPVWTSCFDF